MLRADFKTSQYIYLQKGGANGSIRFKPEIEHGANAGLTNALKLLEPIKKKHPNVGYADLMQMASAVAIEVTGGPKIPMRYGKYSSMILSIISYLKQSYHSPHPS